MIHCKDCETYNYWKLPWARKLGPCDNCRSTNVEEVAWPSDDVDHPFHKLKEKIEEKIKND